MSKKLKIVAISGAVAIASTLSAGVIYSAVNANDGIGADENKANSSSVASADSSKLVDENVYVFTRADGSVRKIVSSDWTKNLDIDEYTNFQTDDKKLPIELRVTYKLDGESISAKDLAGKKGRVTMHYEFTNKEIVDNYYMPYAVISGLILDNAQFTNVEVKNAKLINDGTRTIIAGIMLPGMQENLGLSTSVFEIPSDFEVSADTSDFALGMTVSIATNEIFKDLDLSSVDSLDQLTASINKMSDAMEQLVGGSSDLAKGLNTLYEKVNNLPESTLVLSQGATSLSTGAAKLDAGIEQLSAGLNALAENNTLLVGGAEETFNKLLTITHDQLEAQLGGLVPIPTLTIDNYVAVLDQIKAALPAPYQPAIENAKNGLIKYNEFYSGIIDYTSGVQQAATSVKSSVKPGSAALADGANKLSVGTNQLNSAMPALVDGVEQLRDGSAKLASGIRQFNAEGIQRLVSIYNNDIKGLIDKLQDIANIAKNNSKNIKYIYRTDEIKK